MVWNANFESLMKLIPKTKSYTKYQANKPSEHTFVLVFLIISTYKSELWLFKKKIIKET